MKILKERSINYDVYRRYIEGDENFKQGRVPELGATATAGNPIIGKCIASHSSSASTGFLSII